MSKIYNRAHTPTTPPHLSKKSSNHSSSSKVTYDHLSKSYRSYDRYEDTEAFDHSKYSKPYKNDRFDKFEKTNYKSNSSDKNDYDKYESSKSMSKVRDVALPYKSKTVYKTDSYSDRDNYLAKYSQESYNKSYSSSRDGGNYSTKQSSTLLDSKRYSPYSSTKMTDTNYSTKYENHKSYDDNYNNFYSGSRPAKISGEKAKDNSSIDAQSESNNYQRYVFGNSVNYGSPGRYPENSYPSPKSKARQSSYSPSNYSKFTSPRQKGNDVIKRWSPYSHRTPPRRPPSPPPLPPSYRQSSPQRYKRNYTPPLKRNLTPPPKRNFTPPPDRDRRFDVDKGRNGRDTKIQKATSNIDITDTRRASAIPKPMGSPKPLLSIPLSLNNVPRESRANLRETLGIDSPKRRFDKVKGRRFEGRIGRGSTNARAQSPTKDRRRRRPDDLRLWIESRKTEGNKRKASPRLKRDRPNTSIPRSRLLESRKRLVNKGRRKSNLPVKRTLIKGKRPLPSRNHTADTRRSRERTTKKTDVREADGATSKANKVIRRPRVISNANSLPVRSKVSRRSPQRTRERTPQKEKTYRSSDRRSRSRQREKNVSTKSERVHNRSKSKERSPKRDNKSRRD